MEAWHKYFFLKPVISALFLVCAFALAPAVRAADATDDTGLIPQVERRDVDTSRIDASNFEIGLSGGLLSIEDFGSSSLVVARLTYHVSEDVFVEARLGHSEAGRTSFENLSGSATLLTDSQRKLDFYDVALGFKLLPGEAFWGKRYAFNTAFYLTGGLGTTRFAGDHALTFTAGGGYRLVANDFVAVDFQVRDHLFETGITGATKTTHNLEVSAGLSIYF